MTDQDNTSKKIALLNDRFRKNIGNGSEVFVTQAFAQKGNAFVFAAINFVKYYEFSKIDMGDNPYGENDFIVGEIDGTKFFFKIDCYDNELNYGSEDPSNPKITRRIGTFLLPEDY